MLVNFNREVYKEYSFLVHTVYNELEEVGTSVINIERVYLHTVKRYEYSYYLCYPMCGLDGLGIE